MPQTFTLTLSGVTHPLDYDRDSFLMSELRDLEKYLGWSWDDWIAALGRQDPDALTYSWWLACKRAGNPLDVPPRQVDFRYGDLLVELVPDPEQAASAGDDPDPGDLPTSLEPTTSEPPGLALTVT